MVEQDMIKIYGIRNYIPQRSPTDLTPCCITSTTSMQSDSTMIPPECPTMLLVDKQDTVISNDSPVPPNPYSSKEWSLYDNQDVIATKYHIVELTNARYNIHMNRDEMHQIEANKRKRRITQQLQTQLGLTYLSSSPKLFTTAAVLKYNRT